MLSGRHDTPVGLTGRAFSPRACRGEKARSSGLVRHSWAPYGHLRLRDTSPPKASRLIVAGSGTSLVNT